MAPADFAVPYAAPMVVKTMEMAQPRAPKKDCGVLDGCIWWDRARLWTYGVHRTVGVESVTEAEML